MNDTEFALFILESVGQRNDDECPWPMYTLPPKNVPLEQTAEPEKSTEPPVEFERPSEIEAAPVERESPEKELQRYRALASIYIGASSALRGA